MAERRVVVLDDDPTGTQCARDVPVLVDPDAEPASGAALYVLTNTRALPRDEAVGLLTRLRDRFDPGGAVEFVLRGDSTLRGHVFAEADVFGARDGVLLFVPAFPEGGRTTVDGVHRVLIDGTAVPVADTEFAADPVFGYTARTMVDWVREIGGRDAVSLPLTELRASPRRLAELLTEAKPGSVVVPDVVDHADLERVSRGLDLARDAGGRVVLRCAATLAAIRAGCLAAEPLPTPFPGMNGPVLVVCGSHTAAATRQLERLIAELRRPPREIDTDLALSDPGQAADRVVPDLAADLRSGVAILSSARRRRAEHGGLDHGAAVMAVLCAVVRRLVGRFGALVTKGGITSADVARVGLGARHATAVGPVVAGVPVWRLAGPGADTIVQVVVPGNVGDDATLVTVGRALGVW